jgi:nonribosomal peptide synthetase DhbF
VQNAELNGTETAEFAGQGFLPRVPGSGAMPLLSAQRPLWVGQQLDPDSPAFNIGQYTEITGDLDVEVLKEAAEACLAEIESLRLRLLTDTGGIYQVVGPVAGPALQRIDLSWERDPTASALSWMERELNRLFDLTSGRCYSWALIRLGPTRFFFCQIYHHLVIDGLGGQLVLQRLRALYEANKAAVAPRRNTAAPFARLPESEEEYRDSPQRTSDREYWMQQLEDCPKLVSLSNRRVASTRWQGRRKTVWLPAETVDALMDLAARLQLTLPRAIVGSIAIIMQRLTSSPDFLLGLVVTGRSKPFRNMAACLVNVVPLRCRFSQGVGVEAAIKEAALAMANALSHPLYRMEDIREDLGLRPNDPHLLGLRINLMPFRSDSRGSLNWTSHNLSIGPIEDLSLSIYDRAEDGGLRIDFDGNFDRYDSKELSEIAGRFKALLQWIAMAPPGAEVQNVPILDARHRWQVIEGFNQTSKGVAAECLSDMFEAQVNRTPNRTALAFHNSQLTYAELDRAANRLARCLSARGIGPENIVALLVPRSPEMVIALLGITKAGAAYLPLDPEHPPARLDYMLQDSGARLAVITSAVRDRLQLPLDARSVVIDDEAVRQELESLPCERLTNSDRVQPLTPNSLHNVIYTSGSTGKPKGVALEHRSFSIFIKALISRVTMRPEERMMAVSTICFDIAGVDLFLPLLQGASVEILDSLESRDPVCVVAAVARSKASVVQATPTFWRALVACNMPRTVRILTGGEALAADMVPHFLQFSAAFNLYGPTETTIYSSWHRITPRDVNDTPVVTVGRPLDEQQFYILDENRSPVPVGVPGELYIAGAGLARGYLHRPELTTEKFLDCPFGAPGRLMYRTGDLAKWREDGEVDFVGRADHQVKIRGFRIEPGEIEATLLRRVPAIKQCVVAARQNRAQNQLIAYYVSVPGANFPETREMRAMLAESLPDYMVPAVFVRLDRMPTTPTGKLDRKALPEPEQSANDKSFRPPVGAMESAICKIFEETTGAPRVGLDDDFFQIGGHSLAAVLCVHRLQREFNREVTLRQLFSAPTPGTLAKSLSNCPEAQLVQRRPSKHAYPTIFLLPGMGGDEPRLVRFRMECEGAARIVALEYPDWTQLLDRDGGMQVLVRHLLRQIEEEAPEGPVWLLGYSMGGYCAHAVALHFKAVGREVAFVGLLDTRALPSPNIVLSAQLQDGSTPVEELWHFVQDLARVLRAVPQRALSRVLALTIVRRLTTPWAKPALSLAARFRHTRLPVGFNYYLHHYFNEARQVAAVKSWYREVSERPVPLWIPAFLFRSEAHLPDDPPDLGWHRHFPDIGIVHLPGTHETMLDPPHLTTLCAQTCAVIGTLHDHTLATTSTLS